MGDALCAADDFIGAGRRFFGSLQRRGVGKLNRKKKITLVLVGMNPVGMRPEPILSSITVRRI